MGFWHTGYMEFHEAVGLGDWRPTPPVYRCVHCDAAFSSPDDLRDHRFHAHPLRRPLLLIRGQEIGTHPLRITSTLKASDVRIEECDRAWLNGAEISVARVPSRLARTSSDVVRLVLQKVGVDAVFELDFRVASTSDLEGVEHQFRRTALGRKLDRRAVEEFISAAARFRSAIGYCDGICTYLYGVLSKERGGASSLPYEAYAGKFSKAAEELAVYDRPLAHTIGGLVAFHFNHFRDAAGLATDASRVGSVSARYAAWLERTRTMLTSLPVVVARADPIETLVTDWETEQILRQASRPLAALASTTGELEAFLNRDVAEFDRVKVRMLLAEVYSADGDIERSLKHARTLRNLPALERWSENLIEALSQDDNERL